MTAASPDPELLPQHPVEGAEGRLVLGDVHVPACVRRITETYLDVIVLGRPAPFDWHRENHASFEYVDRWGLCRVAGDGRLAAAAGTVEMDERLVRLATRGGVERMLRRRSMRAPLIAPIDVTTQDGSATVRCDSIDVSVGGILVDDVLPVSVGHPVSFVLHLDHPVAGLARVARLADPGMGLEFLGLTETDRSRLELAILDGRRGGVLA